MLYQLQTSFSKERCERIITFSDLEIIKELCCGLFQNTGLEELRKISVPV